jgi:hypothetical protein
MPSNLAHGIGIMGVRCGVGQRADEMVCGCCYFATEGFESSGLQMSVSNPFSHCRPLHSQRSTPDGEEHTDMIDDSSSCPRSSWKALWSSAPAMTLPPSV